MSTPSRITVNVRLGVKGDKGDKGDAATVTTPTTIATDTLTLDATHAAKYLRFTNVADITVTIDDEATTPIQEGTVIHLWRATLAGPITIVPHANVTLNTSSPVLAENEGSVLIKIGSNEWDQL